MENMCEELWRDFECLVYNIIKDILQIEETGISKLTQERKDGGYDGIFILPLIEKQLEDMEISYKILFEAKLRSDIKSDLPLQEFSKALIIAINTAADSLIIGTNLHFSENTKKHLSDYGEKTGLSVKVLAGNEIQNWLNSSKNNRSVISENLLSLLSSAAATEEYSKLSNISEIAQEMQFKKSGYTLIGKKRKRQLLSAVNILKKKPELIVITGSAGSGKSFFTNVLRNQIDNIKFIIIDIKLCPTPRILFLLLIEQLWQLPKRLIDSIEEESFMEAISQIGEGTVDSITLKTVMAAFEKNVDEYREKSDIFNYYLIKYLSQISYSQKRKRQWGLNFINLNSASEELLGFLDQLVHGLRSDFRIILELRTSIYVDGYMDMDKWDEYVNRFKSLPPQGGVIEITALEKNEVDDYVDSLYKHGRISTAAKNHIGFCTSKLPLFIEMFVNYLNLTEHIKNVPEDMHSLHIEKLHIDNEIQLIPLMIGSLCKKNPFYSGFFAVMYIFDGTIQEENLSTIFPEYTKNMLDCLINAEMIFFVQDCLQIKHLLILDYLEKFQYIGNSYLQEIAEHIIENIDKFCIPSENKDIIRFKVLRILNQTFEAAFIGHRLALNLYKSGQYFLSYHYGNMALNELDSLAIDNNKILLNIRLLELVIQVSFYLKNHAQNNLKKYTDELESILNLYEWDLRKVEDFCEMRLQSFMILSRYVHTLGDFGRQMQYMETATSFIEKNYDKCTKATIANVWVEYAIAVKQREGVKGYIEVLSEKLKELPDAEDLTYTYNSAMYQKMSISTPEEAMVYVEKNIEMEEKMALPEIYHNRVHKANNLLYCKDYDNALSYSLNLLSKTGEIGLQNESGRLCNIIGCAYFIKEDFKTAKKYFTYGIEIYKNNNYVSYLWPILINLATLHFKLGQKREALDVIRQCIELFQKYKTRTNNLDLSFIPFPKSYVANILLLYYLRKIKNKQYQETVEALINSLIDGITLPSIIEFINGSNRLPNGLKKTSYYHNGIILIGY